MDFFANLLVRITATFVISMIIWLPIVLSLLWEGQKFKKQVDGRNYELRQPKFMFWSGLVCVLLFTLPIIIGPAIWDESFFPIGTIFFGAFALLSSFLVAYGIQWRIRVQYNWLIVRMPFKAEREIAIGEITTVEEKQNGITAYIDGERFFSVGKHVPGLELIWAQLYEAGKLESTQKQNVFVVRQHMVHLVIGILGTLLFGSIFVYMIFLADETFGGFHNMSVFALLCFSLYFVVQALRWRLTVAGDTLMMRGVMGEEKSYTIQSITWVDVKDRKIVLYTDQGKLAKVAFTCRNFPILSERLRLEGITFMYKGKPAGRFPSS